MLSKFRIFFALSGIVCSCFASDTPALKIVCFGNDKLLEHYAAGIAEFEKEFAQKYNAEYVPDMQCNIVPKGRRDLWSDSNHPNAKGNRIVADTILPALRKILK